ncbi:MAG: hypothetical protein DME79_03665 [Verrucomicrobia bacterium]|nr:MAG: hypothetical protein DME79_03665 [Verrucomicrobiota bacterium]
MRWLRLLNGQVSKQLLHEAANSLLRDTYYSRLPNNSVFLTIKKRREDASALLKPSRNAKPNAHLLSFRTKCFGVRGVLASLLGAHRWAQCTHDLVTEKTT